MKSFKTHLIEKEEIVEYTDKEVKMAVGIAADPRYKGGNMTGAVKAIEKIKKGLSKHKKVAAVLQRVNEEPELDEAMRVLAKKGKTKVVTKGDGVAKVMIGNKEVASGDLDDGAGGWFMSRPGEKGQKFFDSPQKIADFYKEDVDIVDTIKSVMEDGYSQNPTGDGTDLSLNDIKNPDVIDQLNAHIGMIGQREYMNPKGAMLQLQQKLNTIGIHFEIPSLPEETGTVNVALTQFGGVFGKGVDTPIDQFDHDNPAEGLSIAFEYEKLKTGCTKIYAKIV